MRSGKSGAAFGARLVSLIALLFLSLTAGMLGAQEAGQGAGQEPAAVMETKVNINEADADTIAAELDGVGPAKARAIIEYRDKHGPFASVDELREVSGIGEATVNLNRSRILLK